MVYKWSEHARLSCDAQKVGERLEALQERAGRKVTPRAVIDDARDEQSPMHGYFEWNDTVAAEHYREEQARYLIRSLRILQPDKQEPTQTVRAFVNVTSDERAYHPMARILAEPGLYAQALEQAARDLRSFEERYRGFADLASIINRARVQIEELRTIAA